MTIEQLRRKKIAVLGMGTNNRKLAEYLKAKQIGFDILEWNHAEELVGKLDNYELVFRTPGLPYLSKAIVQARSKGVEISSQTKLFFELCPAPIIGVTGTKGKGTTSSLIAAILAAAGRKVWLGGNIGRDPFEFLDQIKPADNMIMELSSFQLQDMTVSPHIAVVLKITPDHLNHHQSMEEYLDSKANILKYQQPTDVAVLDPKLPQSFAKLGLAKKIFFDPAEAAKYPTRLLGQHNQINIAAAVATTRMLGVEDKIISTVVAEFKTLPHHLEVVGVVNGITYVDDGVSTNIEPAVAAIHAISGPTILIVGGHDKGLQFEELGKTIISASNLKAVVVVGEVADKILKAISGFKGQILTGAKNMTEILEQARSVAVAGDTILISPATDSFDMFKNTYDRAEQFVSEVMKLK